MRALLEDLRARGLKCESVLDVGAHKTEWSRMAKAVFPGANCFLIEPLAEMQPLLNAFCGEFPGSRGFHAGAGSQAGEMTLTSGSDLAGASLLPFSDETVDESGAAIEAPGEKRRPVAVVTIDDLMASGDLPPPQLVKLDVQGFELEALRGASTLFECECVQVFVLEVSLFEFMPGMPIFHEVVGFMEQRGYYAYDFPGFLRRPFDGALAQVDICFVRKNGFLRASNAWT